MQVADVLRIPFHRDTPRAWPRVVEAALVLVLAAQVAWLGWTAFAPRTAGSLRAPVPAEVPLLSGHDPFFAGATDASAAGIGGWRLHGVRTGAGGGSAILARDSGPQAVFLAGEEVAPGVVLDSVTGDHVVLRRGESRHRVELPLPTGTTQAPAGAAPAAPSTGAASAPAPMPKPAATTAQAVDPAQFLVQAGLRLTSEAGRVAGYTLLPRGDDRLARAAGLQPGDVLLSVNGQALDPEHLPELVEQLKSSPHAVIAYRRDGQTRTVTLGNGSP
jgi:general secretion pathway protein C